MITFLTATIPTRTTLLAELLDSVAVQTVKPWGHRVEVDWQHEDNLVLLNRMSLGVTSEWLCPTGDDDLVLPDFSERMLAASTDADVVYGYCDLSSWPEGAPQRAGINHPWDPERLSQANWIPGGCALIRTDLFRYVGGYPLDGPNATQLGDWHLWLRLLDAGARFACLPEVTWIYRYHERQKECAGIGAW